MKIEVYKFKNKFFNNVLIIVDYILNFERKYKIKIIINNNYYYY